MPFPLEPTTAESATLYRVGQKSTDGTSVVVQRLIDNAWTHVWEPVAGGGVTTVKDPAGTALTNVGGVVTLPTPIDNLTSTSTTDALAANQGKVLNDADIASLSIVGANLVVTLKGGATKTLDISALQLDVKLVDADYNPTAKEIDFLLSDGSTISMPSAALLPVTTDATLSGNGSTTPLKVELSTDAGNALVYGTDGKIKVVVPSPGSFWSSSTAAANTPAIPDGTTDLTEKLRRDGFVGLGVDPVAAFDFTGGIINRPLALPNQSANGALVAADITNNSMLSIAQTTKDIVLTISDPTVAQAGRYLRVANTGTAPIVVGGVTIAAKSFGDYIWDGTTWEPQTNIPRLPLQPMLESDGTIKHSLNNEVRWTGQLTVTTQGVNTRSVSGFHDITMPADGFAIPVANGTTRAVVPATAGNSGATGGILLSSWESLWYKIPDGSTNAFLPENLLIQGHTTATKLSPDDGWVLIASRVSSHSVKWFNGDHTTLGMQFGGSLSTTIANWTMMRNRAQGDGYFFSPGGDTTIAKAVGFTGGIRWINGGTSPYINNSGYIDVNQISKVAGTPIIGLGAASRTWRLMTAAEKPEYFGGAINPAAHNRIDPAVTTVMDLAVNEVLYYAPQIDNTGVDKGNWFVVSYAYTSAIPIHWLPIASSTIYTRSTIQVLVGGLPSTLRPGEARWMGRTEANIDMLHRRMSIIHQGNKYCRWTIPGFFTGTGDNGLTVGGQGVMVSWDDNTLNYGISDGNSSWGCAYTWINVPAAGTKIPVVGVNTAITRVVETIGGHRYIPLAQHESLYYIPPASCGGNNSIDSDFVITHYGLSAHIPNGAVLAAKPSGSLAASTPTKMRVKFADGSYIQPGSDYAVAPIAEYDHAQGSGAWRNATVPGGTPPAATAPLPAVAGVLGVYPGYRIQYRYESIPESPQGVIRLKGLLQLNGSVAAASTLVFLPGVVLSGEAIFATHGIGSTSGDGVIIPISLRAGNSIVGGQSGVKIYVTGATLNTTSPQWTGRGTPVWVALDNICLAHA